MALTLLDLDDSPLALALLDLVGELPGISRSVGGWDSCCIRGLGFLG